MKKSLAFLIFCSLFFTARSQYIPDGGFENWTLKSGTSPTIYAYYDPTDAFWGTLNELAQLSSMTGGPGPVSVFKSTEAFAGASAAQMMSGIMVKLDPDVFVPGLLGTAKLDIMNVAVHVGRPYTFKPKRFQLYYKYQPVGGDSAHMFMLLSKYNTIKKQRDTIAYAGQIVKTAVPAYTLFSQDLVYSDTLATPDSITILFASSAGYDFKNLTKCKGQVGSQLWIDEVRVMYPVSIKELPACNLNIRVYPNPVKDVLYLQTETAGVEFRLFNAAGQIIHKQILNQGTTILPTTEMAPGMYYFISEKDPISQKGKIFIQ
jgi:hypothetical protein